MLTGQCHCGRIVCRFDGLPDTATVGFHFGPDRGCVTWWRAVQPDEGGRTRIAVNLRMAEPGSVAAIPLRRFDGLDSFGALPGGGRCVSDVWF